MPDGQFSLMQEQISIALYEVPENRRIGLRGPQLVPPSALRLLQPVILFGIIIDECTAHCPQERDGASPS